jgi:RNA polymerase sigma-70 factor (ECF subfamily)
MMKFHKARQSFTGKGTFKSWLYTIAMNTIKDFRRRQYHRKNQDDELSDIPDKNPSAYSITESRELYDILVDVVQSMPEIYRDPFLLIRYHGMSYKEAADICDCSISAIKMRVHRGLQYITESLDKKGCLENYL